LIKEQIWAFASDELPCADGIWLSLETDQEKVVANASRRIAPSPWLFNGLSGVLFLMSLLREKHFDLTPVNQRLYASWAYVETEVLNQATKAPGGLYQGSFGVAIALAAGIQSGGIIDTPKTRGFLKQLL